MPRIPVRREAIRDFCQRNRIRRLAFFGSVLRSDFRPDSDVDVLVEFEPGAKVGLRFFAMEKELTTILGHTVDLNTPGFLSRYFRERVIAEAEPISEGCPRCALGGDRRPEEPRHSRLRRR